MDDAQYILWMDNDSLIVNQTLSLESLIAGDPGKDFYISSDFNGINFGVFAVRNSEWSRQLFESLFFVPAVNSTLAVFQDQQALSVALESLTVSRA